MLRRLSDLTANLGRSWKYITSTILPGSLKMFFELFTLRVYIKQHFCCVIPRFVAFKNAEFLTQIHFYLQFADIFQQICTEICLLFTLQIVECRNFKKQIVNHPAQLSSDGVFIRSFEVPETLFNVNREIESRFIKLKFIVGCQNSPLLGASS